MLELSQADYESGLTKWTEYVNTNNLDLNNEDDLNTFLDEVIKYYFPDSSQGGSPDGSSGGSPDGSSGGSSDGSSGGSPDGSSDGSSGGSSDGSPDGQQGEGTKEP
ncbi:hypothetical protein BGW42_002918 [Actinomortierella wolfii]|nr:hypothetical protein BGW42_002918 [Actinomortierella wolfii]